MSIASRFPDIERQYAGGVPVREWVSTDRVQCSSKHLVGDRWCLLAHAAGFRSAPENAVRDTTRRVPSPPLPVSVGQVTWC